MPAKPSLTKIPSGTGKDSSDLEVLPPERSGDNKSLSRLIAYLMDNVLKLPGTRKGVGVNPILDLIPVFGDGAATILQMLMILEAARRGVPKIVLARMGMNVLINGAIGQFPIPGPSEAFAWWFRPSSRNYELLLKHAPQDGGLAKRQVRRNTRGDYLFVFGLLAVVFIVMAALITLGFYAFFAFWHWLFTAHGA